MLESIDGKRMKGLPHRDQYNRRVGRLRSGLAGEVQNIIARYCDSHNEVTAGWLFSQPEFPPKHQEMTDALRVEEEANQLLGQMLWEVLRARPEVWLFYRPESEGEFPAAMRYWRKERLGAIA